MKFISEEILRTALTRLLHYIIVSAKYSILATDHEAPIVCMQHRLETALPVGLSLPVISLAMGHKTTLHSSMLHTQG